ncbi:MAG: hypothetical protein GY842_12720 [bacterium]|nr:hypothetical protein [bacterium]
MHVVALTTGGPYERYVLNELHRRCGLRAVIMRAGLSPEPGTTLRRQYWSTANLLRRISSDGWPAVHRWWLSGRIRRWEDRLRGRALREVLEVREDLPFDDGLEVVEVANLNGSETTECLRRYAPDVLLLLGCPIIRRPILESARRGVLNCHTSLLPAFRGVAPEYWILLSGRHDCAGVTIHWATEHLDAGAITAQRRVEVLPGDDPFRLRARCMVGAVNAFDEVLNALASGDCPGQPQPPAAAAYRASQLTPELRWQCCLMGRARKAGRPPTTEAVQMA